MRAAVAGSGCCCCGCIICCSISGVISRKNSEVSLNPADSMNRPKVLRYWLGETSGLAMPIWDIICSCFCRIAATIAICCSRLPVPRPTFTVRSYSLLHSRGSIATNLPRIRTIRSLSWYLQTRCRMDLNRSFTPVSANILAINSTFAAPAF